MHTIVVAFSGRTSCGDLCAILSAQNHKASHQKKGSMWHFSLSIAPTVTSHNLLPIPLNTHPWWWYHLGSYYWFAPFNTGESVARQIMWAVVVMMISPPTVTMLWWDRQQKYSFSKCPIDALHHRNVLRQGFQELYPWSLPLFSIQTLPPLPLPWHFHPCLNHLSKTPQHIIWNPLSVNTRRGWWCKHISISYHGHKSLRCW